MHSHLRVRFAFACVRMVMHMSNIVRVRSYDRTIATTTTTTANSGNNVYNNHKLEPSTYTHITVTSAMTNHIGNATGIATHIHVITTTNTLKA